MMGWRRLIDGLMACVPARLRENKMESFVLSSVWVIVGWLLCAALGERAQTWGASVIVLAQLGGLLALYQGVPLRLCIQYVLSVALVALCYIAWSTGGLFSPFLAWLTMVPVISFHLVGRRQGLWWTGGVYALVLCMAYVNAQHLLEPGVVLGDDLVWTSLTINLVVPVALMLVPMFYDKLYKRGLQTSKERTLALEQKRQELLRASEIREHFISIVSHELRTPMNAILGFNDMLLSRVQDRPEALKILNHTRQSADHLLTVINDVLDHSQLQAGQLSVHTETFALRETVNNAFGLFHLRVQSMRIDYDCIIDPDVPVWVKTDRHRLMQVLVNLLGNAIKFTHQGYVILRVRAHDNGVRFLVEDSGIGISHQQRGRIFQRFSQADSGIQNRYGGNGLGLSISQRLVALLGGEIGFESEPGCGAVFWFDLPLREVAAPTAGQTTHGVVHESAEAALRFLVVDDHPINRLLIRQILHNTWKNCVLVEADNGLKALHALKSQPFDVVLMDMVMPEMDGIEATHSLRKALPPPACNTPVLGLTANVNPQDLARFEAAGVNAVLLKPFDQDKLCAQVEALLSDTAHAHPG